MKCIIPGVNLKVFGKSIHSLSKIGEELYFEPLEHGLALRTVNACRSAYACFLFAPSFFTYYDDGTDRTTNPDDEGLKCKIGMKSCLSVFKSLSTIEKTVDKCKITLDMNESRLVFQLHCKHGIVKTFNLSFIECETLQAVFDKSHCPNGFTAHARLLTECVLNFQTTQEEISLIYDMDKCKIKNYTDDEPDPLKAIKTEMTLSPAEFENYQIDEDGEVTFCLKELRAILAFAEAANLPLSLHFESAGKPLVFSMETDPTFEANFVLATLAETSSQLTASQQNTQTQLSQNQRTFVQKRQTAASNSVTSNGIQPTLTIKSNGASGDGPSTRGVSRNTSNPADRRAQKPRPSAAADGNSRGKDKQSAEPSAAQPADSASNIHADSTIERPRQSAASRLSAAAAECLHEEEDELPDFDAAMRTMSQSRLSDNKSDETSQVIPVLSERTFTDSCAPPGLATTSGTLQNTSTLDDLSEEEGEEVPGTPPSKKFKSAFFGLSQSTVTSEIERRDFGAVLAEDSEDD